MFHFYLCTGNAEARKVHQVCSQLDILPSAASLARQSYRNITFGRDLFDSTDKQQRFAFMLIPIWPASALLATGSIL
jgi:hypothetical protein